MRPDGAAAVVAGTPAQSIATYIRAKDTNRPELMKCAFTGEAALEMVVKAGTISFPPFTKGLASITEVLVTRFGETFENVHTFCLAAPPEPQSRAFSCAWLVGMTERRGSAVRVGCGRYDWSFEDGGRLANGLRITVERMEVLPPHDLNAVMDWLSGLPYPWCDSAPAIDSAPRLEALRPIFRYLEAWR